MLTVNRIACGWCLVALLAASWARASDIDGDGVPDNIDVCCNTLPGSIVDAEGRPLGDVDGDCDVDLADFAIIANNFTGPGSCSPEACDGLDNDCNCVVDDMGTVSCGTGACFNTVLVCSNGVSQICTPLPSNPESCNGIDDNCDGLVDEPFDLQTDVGNCGTCGYACSLPQNGTPVCVAGQCDSVCYPSFADCDMSFGNGCEIYLPQDAQNCGACGNVCVPPPNAVAQCNNSACSFFCDPDYGDCNNNPVDGCEVYLPGNAQHCGGCNLVCPPFPNATPTCVNNNCVPVCNVDYADCDNFAGTGCEAFLAGDLNNCGGCNIACPTRPNSVPTCQNGNCSFVCNTGFADCNGNPVDGCEANTQTSSQHCGGCSIQCFPGDVCVNGQCTSP